MKLFFTVSFLTLAVVCQYSFANEQLSENPNNPKDISIPSGLEGLRALEKQDKIRLASPIDIDAWIEVAHEKYKKDEANIKNHMRIGATYVVFEEIQLPDELYGAHAVSFIIPKEVPKPIGPDGHNKFYFMEGGFCTLVFISECPEG